MFDIAIFIVLLALGYGFGQAAEKRHYRKITAAEVKFNSLPAIASRYPPEQGSYQQQLVVGSVVIAGDYFKTAMAGLVNFLGGSVVSYESLLDRGRREAVIRMKEQASALNAELIFNVKFETSSVGGRGPSIEVLAYGTALSPLQQFENRSQDILAGETASEAIAARLGS